MLGLTELLQDFPRKNNTERPNINFLSGIKSNHFIARVYFFAGINNKYSFRIVCKLQIIFDTLYFKTV